MKLELLKRGEKLGDKGNGQAWILFSFFGWCTCFSVFCASVANFFASR